MPSTLSSISTLLDSAGIKHQLKDDVIRTGFSTDLYEDDDGEPETDLPGGRVEIIFDPVHELMV